MSEPKTSNFSDYVRYAAKLEQDKKDGQSLGVTKTPTFFVNGRRLARMGESDLKSLIDQELKK